MVKLWFHCLSVFNSMDSGLLDSKDNRPEFALNVFIQIESQFHYRPTDREYKACSNRDRTFAIKTLLLILQHFKHCPFKLLPSTGDTPFLTFLPLLECFLERTCCNDAQFFYRIFLNLLYCLETKSLQSGFKFGKQEKSLLGLSLENRMDGAQRMSDILTDNCG